VTQETPFLPPSVPVEGRTDVPGATGPESTPGRVYEVEVPLRRGKPPLTANQRLHWAEKAKRTKEVRQAVGWGVKAAKIPPSKHIAVWLNYATGDQRRRDPSNLMPTQKAALDGVVDAGIVSDDDPRHVTEWMPVIHPGPGVRRLWLTVEIKS
jgi:crossover junction endodeoxyribonuclease RusA